MEALQLPIQFGTTPASQVENQTQLGALHVLQATLRQYPDQHADFLLFKRTSIN